MATSAFEDLFSSHAVPALLERFGVAAVHTDADGDETAVRVILTQSAEPIGDYGERVEVRHVIEAASADGAVVGDTWSIEQTPTDEDPFPDAAVWRAEQLLDDNGMFTTFSVRRVP